MLLSWPLAEQRRFFEEEVGLALALEAETGKLFPASNQARDVRDGLLALAARRGVEIRFDARSTDSGAAGRTAPGSSRLRGGEGDPRPRP